MTIVIAVSTSIALNKQEWLGEKAGKPMLELIIGLIVYFIPFTVLMAFIWAFTSLPGERGLKPLASILFLESNIYSYVTYELFFILVKFNFVNTK